MATPPIRGMGPSWRCRPGVGECTSPWAIAMLRTMYVSTIAQAQVPTRRTANITIDMRYLDGPRSFTQHLHGSGAQRELRNDLGPIFQVLQQRHPFQFFRHDDGVAGMEFKVQKVPSPQADPLVTAHHCAIGTNDEHPSTVGIFGGASGLLQVFPHGLS